jgi:hypothetical protein
MYSLYLYFFGLSLRKTSEVLDIFDNEKLSYILYGIRYQWFGSYYIYNRKRVSTFLIDERIIQIGDNIIGYWSVLNLFSKQYSISIFQLKEIHVCSREFPLGP